MAAKEAVVRVERWNRSHHPTLSAVNRILHKEGLRPYLWSPAPNHRQPVRSHGYRKVLYVVEGMLEVLLPDSNQRFTMRSGDRLDVPPGVRHGLNVGSSGAKCVEAALRQGRRSA